MNITVIYVYYTDIIFFVLLFYLHLNFVPVRYWYLYWIRIYISMKQMPIFSG
jgi:hypothetical protein